MKGWEPLLNAAAATEAALRGALQDPKRAQSNLLCGIIKENARTDFGRRRGFANIRSIDDYRRATPVQGYAAFRQSIEEIAGGASNVLMREAPIAFEETGGTASGRKLIPYTAASLAGFRAAVLPWLANLASRRRGIVRGSAYISISPVARPLRRTASGIPVGLGSEAAYLGEDLAQALLTVLAVPPEVAALSDIDEWRVATLAHLVERDDLSFVSIWSPTFFLELIRALPSCAEEVARRIGAQARARLNRILSRPLLETSSLWPRLDTISCWSDGSSKSLARQLAALCPQATIEPKGLLATEAAITLPWNDAFGCIPALTSTFIEFMGEADDIRMAHELDEGASYRIVVTTSGGLYRYDMGDRVRCVSREGAVPRLVFEGRAGLVSDMVGEKLDEAFVAGVLEALGEASALAPRLEPKPHYELWLDRGDIAPDDACGRVERGLGANPQYAYARAIGQLDKCVPVLKPGFVARRNIERVAAGGRMGDFKHTSLILDPFDRKNER